MTTIQGYLVMMAGFSTLAVFLIGLVNAQILKVWAGYTGFVKQFTGWLVCFLVAICLHAIGILPATNAFGTIINGFILGLISNGIYTIPMINGWLNKKV